jgi:glyoxylase-like metal-dependent hydrolase (beta-lactamase superfamily II)
MEILVNQFSGPYQTNCYIIDRKIVIDPGEGAARWVAEVAPNPVAIINTHGHFDHIWDNGEIQRRWRTPLYIHRADAPMLNRSQLGITPPPSRATHFLEEGSLKIGGIEFTVYHFPGHTPGSVALRVGDYLFTGDFIFKGSIGRVDFPSSDPVAMADSLEKVLKLPDNLIILPGHGEGSRLGDEKPGLRGWIKWLKGNY